MKATQIKGTITLTDGSVREFQIGTDGGWSQWGATREQLGASVVVVEAMVKGLFEEELLASERDTTCAECGAPAEPVEDGLRPLCTYHEAEALDYARREHFGE